MPASADTPFEVVAEGLDNPRGLTVAPDGAVYVAEAGRGGDECFPIPQQNGVVGEELCFGLTGAITRVGDGSPETVVADLPSASAPGGFFAGGPHDVTTYGPGRFEITVGGFARGFDEPPTRFRNHYSPLFGTVARVDAHGRSRVVADLLAYEGAGNLDGGTENESNPYGILDAPGLFGAATDAAGNTLLRYGPGGRITPLAVFPADGDTQFVPTAVTRGPDGALYVSEFTGFPFPVGGAQIWRVPAGAASPRCTSTA